MSSLTKSKMAFFSLWLADVQTLPFYLIKMGRFLTSYPLLDTNLIVLKNYTAKYAVIS